MIIRVRGPSGACRIEVDPSDQTSKLFEEASAKLKTKEAVFKLSRGRDGSDEIPVQGYTIEGAQLKHGDMIYLTVDPASVAAGPAEPAVEIAEVDRILDSRDGLVLRKKDPSLCRGAGCTSFLSKCIHCLPLQPFDDAVLNMRDPPIKKLSFHSYLRKLRSAGETGRSSNIINLQEPRCTVKDNCSSCAGWPKSICTKCQPSAMLLKAQEYRHVDYVSFDSDEIVGNFIKAWTGSGVQRIGYMYGKYAVYDQVPLGIQAIVSCIYEPPQMSEPDGVELLEDPNAKTVDQFCALMGLQKVGWIFTDLEVLPSASPPNNTKYKRFESDDNSVLTGYEVIYAALQQCGYPNAIAPKYSSKGVFGSKFVTCVVSGGEENEINVKAYQATNNAMALVRAEALAPSAIKRNEVCVRESDKDHYVPEVLYVHKNEYGREVTTKADPGLPLEYLFVTLENGFGLDTEKKVFKASDFPIENRSQLGQVQELPAVQKALSKTGSLLSKLADFHLLLFLATNEIVPFLEDMPTITKSILAKDNTALEQWAAQSEKWQTLQVIMQCS